MRKRLEKPPRFVYSVFGETGDPPTVWHAISFTEEASAVKAVNSLNGFLLSAKYHYDNFEKPVQVNPPAFDLTYAFKAIKSIDDKFNGRHPGARYSMIRYKYDEAKEKNRLPPGVK